MSLTMHYVPQVAELKSELVKKHKQQEHLKSKYQKMQEVRVCCVWCIPAEPTSARLLETGKQARPAQSGTTGQQRDTQVGGET